MIETFTVSVHPIFYKEWEEFIEANEKFITVETVFNTKGLQGIIDQQKKALDKIQDILGNLEEDTEDRTSDYDGDLDFVLDALSNVNDVYLRQSKI